jgi:uncharacterized membrane protein
MRTTKPSKEELSRWHEDPSNWKWGVIYFNPLDPRVWLPKRIPVMGWTLNFARKAAFFWLLFLLILPVMLIWLVSLVD